MGQKSWGESLELNHGRKIMGGIFGVESWQSKSWEESLELNHGGEIVGGITGVES